MKLVRHGNKGQENPGILDENGRIRDLSDHISDITCQALAPDQLKRLGRLNLNDLPIIEGSPRLGVPIANIGNIFGIGLNYKDHAEEAGMPLPEEPILFTKATSSINGPSDTVILPKGSKKSDWEVELGVIIGQKAQHVEKANALDYVAGYTIVNDLSERAFQMEHGAGQWVKGKCCETFAPIGPWLVTKDDVPNPQNLNLWLDLNGERRQTGNTRSMIFGVADLISYLSKFMALMPGDIITTGTPPGVGMGCKPPVFLKQGDKMRLGVEGLGEQNQEVLIFKN
ncbi:MAG: fumarylacetoacetate hydrolase family protein [Rhodospirillales bacterium]|nr:fumarylacetoacetate hydrolase family protein [Rhodospirillales bacterium]